MLKYRSLNSSRVKCIIPLPLFMGFVVGILSVYSYYLFLNYDDKKLIPASIEQEYVGQTNFNSHQNNYHRIDFTKPTISHNNTSLLCLIFINDIDSFHVQQNVWLDKCGNDKMYVSKQKHMYIGHVLTETYSPHPWKYYCQTLLYLHEKYNSGTIKYDWIFLAKDDIWLIYENLIYLISLINVNKHKHNYYAGQYVDGVINVNAGLLLSANTLAALFHLFSSMDACSEDVSDNENQMLNFYIRKLNNVIPISNMDSYGCTLFHSSNLTEAFNVKSLRPEILKKCMSKSAITFQMGISSNYYAMFYKYALYKIRLVSNQDLMYNSKNILPAPSLQDEDIWRIEALYELNLDPSNMSQTDFFYYWSKHRQIIL